MCLLPSCTNGWPHSYCIQYMCVCVFAVWFYTHTTARLVFHSVCRVWLPIGPPECFSFGFCTWLWKCLIDGWVSWKSLLLTFLQRWRRWWPWCVTVVGSHVNSVVSEVWRVPQRWSKLLQTGGKLLALPTGKPGPFWRDHTRANTKVYSDCLCVCVCVCVCVCARARAPEKRMIFYPCSICFPLYLAILILIISGLVFH